MSYLTPHINDTVKDFLSDSDRVSRLVESFGSPLNLVFPEQVTKNLNSITNVFNSYNVQGKVFYATKANKSNAILRKLSNTKEASIDVASSSELIAALSSGFSADRIEATGPKNDEFLRLCIAHGVILNVDDIAEFEQIQIIAAKLGIEKKVRVLLRIAYSNKSVSAVQDVRFGMRPSELDEVLTSCVNNQLIDFIGFSFHLASTSDSEKAAMLQTTCEYVMKASNMGLSSKVINIGGGLAINYVYSKNEWDEYISKLKRSLLDSGIESMSWRGSGLGFWVEDGKLRGSGKYSDFYIDKSPAEQLSKLFDVELTKFNTSFGEFLSESGVSVFVEPGRALLEQAGVTIGKVLYTKSTASNETVVICDMNRTNLNSQDMEYMADPILISTHQASSGSGFLAGNLCLPHDFLTRRKVFFKQMPRKDDLLVFANTAGYLMDFAESNTLRQSIAKKIAVTAQYEYYEDDKYPVL